MELIPDSEMRIQIINDVLKTQQGRITHYSQEGINYLKHITSGGVVALLAFIGASDWASENINIKCALGFFVFGLTLTGILIWYMFLSSFYISEKYKQEQQNCLLGHLEYRELFNKYFKRNKINNKISINIAIFISISWFLGLGFAYYGFAYKY